jgi:hypothetical protein
MNNHTEIQMRLPAYCGGDLEPAELRLVEDHLAECPACRAELADLQTALRLVRSTPEIEPPPWMTARIMARIREQQAVKKSWLQRIFFPLHIKLPLEAIALLMVCISGYYLTRTVETNLEQARQQQFQEIPAQHTPTAAPSTTQPAPRADKAEQPSALQPQTLVPPAAAPQGATRREGLPAQTPAHTPITPAPAPAPYAPAPPLFRDQQESKAETMKAAPAAETSNRALEAAPEMRSKSRRSLELQGDSAAPAAAGRSAGAPAGPALPQAVVRIDLDDPQAAQAMVREAVVRCGGTVVEEPVPSGQRLKARIPAGRQRELLERLERLGRISERPATPPAGAQLLEITIHW